VQDNCAAEIANQSQYVAETEGERNVGGESEIIYSIHTDTICLLESQVLSIPV